MLSQLTTAATEKWAALTALLTTAAIIVKKLLSRRPPPKPDSISRAEFHAAMDANRDRIGASYLALCEKLEQSQAKLFARFDRVEERLDRLDSTVARLDERTKQ
jgi:hypothetical protein